MPATAWVALLRAVNVGGRNAVPMAGLRELVGDLGGRSVATYVQSGNVVFAHGERDRDALAAQLEERLAESFGVATVVILRTAAELGRLEAAQPFGPDASQTFVSFLAAAPAPEAVARLAAADAGPDEFLVAGSDVFLRYPAGVGGARLTGSLLERRLGVPGTTRSWRTVVRLAGMAAGLDAERAA